MKNTQRRKNRLKNTDYIFLVLYVAEFLGAALIAFLGNSFFAYEVFNSLWADILYLILLSSLFVTAFVQEMCASRKTGDVILNFAVFIVGAVVMCLFYIFDGVFALCALAFSAIMFIVVGFRYTLLWRKDETIQPDPKRIIAVPSFLLFAMVRQLSVEYVDNEIWARSLIPAAILFVAVIVVVVLLIRKAWSNSYTRTAARIGNAICAVVMLFLLIYFYSVTAIGTANCVFDGEPTAIECVVLEKNIVSGTHTVTQFEVKIKIDDKEMWIDVHVTDYHGIEEGDVIIIDYYQGALNLPYYKYSGKVEL